MLFIQMMKWERINNYKQKIKMKSKMMNYQKAKAFIADKHIESPEEYQKWYNENREYLESIGLPEHPDKYYSKPGNVRTYLTISKKIM